MKTYKLKGILQKSGWIENAHITVDKNGLITDISASDHQHKHSEIINGYAIPGFQNAHSHAFQYAMAGLAEQHKGIANPDDFWSWREAMYQLALGLDPDQMEAIATMLYSEMARNGYTNVAEFHYIHHDKNGIPYANVAEMGSRLIAAAKTVGLGITLVPIFYQKGGFGQEPTHNQRRFISSTIDHYLKLLEASTTACSNYENATIGIGVHSMRGVSPFDIAEIAKSGPQNIPFHIHVSEQLKEVEDALKHLNQRPVEWLLDNVNLNERYHLVHATHLTDNEIIGIAKSKANVVLCPSTEGNLGDGLFPLRRYQKAGGRWSIGTDSHIGISPLEELRLLDYGQRLISHKRNTYFSENQGDAGAYAIEMANTTGRKAMNNYTSDFFEIGSPFNATIFDAESPLIATTSMKNLASTIVYAADATMQIGTISYGKMIVTHGIHHQNEEIKNRFTRVISMLKNR